MKKGCLIVAMCFCATLLFAQVGKESYKVFIYTDKNLDQLIEQSKESNNGERTLFLGAANAVEGIGMGYFTSVVDLGVNAIGGLITQNSENHKKWKEIVAAENKNSISIGTISGIKDFYSTSSLDGGALDPKGMIFSGIGCLRMEGSDTVFYVSCHINKDKINRIVSHSKFELVLDTLIINPCYSNVPNSSICNTSFSFKDRNYLEVGLDIKLISSWITQIATLQQDQQLGAFKVNLRITEKDLNSKGVLYYVRGKNEPAKYSISGESFIVPRSYSGYRDENGKYRDCWGTGEYKVDVILSEACGVSDEYEKAWKQDWKRRKAIEAKKKKNGTLIDQLCQFTRKQEWDALTKQWVVTTLKAPTGIAIGDLKHKLNMPTSSK